MSRPQIPKALRRGMISQARKRILRSGRRTVLISAKFKDMTLRLTHQWVSYGTHRSPRWLMEVKYQENRNWEFIAQFSAKATAIEHFSNRVTKLLREY